MTDARRVRSQHDRLDRITADLRRSGSRVTASRRVIIELLLAAPHHVTADELTVLVHRAHPEIAPSTIYRTMHTLDELGIVTHVHMGHGPTVYHLADEQHHHLVCRRCDQVTEVPGAHFEALAGELNREYGFAIDPHHVALSGICATCDGGSG